MSVSDRRRDKPSAFAQMLRTFFQSYDEANPPDRIAMLRSMPGGSVVAFFTEQALWRTQRILFGITLVELKRLLELAQHESGQIRAGLSTLSAEIEELRARIRSRS